MDYEPEEPARFSHVEEDISVDRNGLSTPRVGQTNISSITNDFPAYLAGGGYQRGGTETLTKGF